MDLLYVVWMWFVLETKSVRSQLLSVVMCVCVWGGFRLLRGGASWEVVWSLECLSEVIEVLPTGW